MSIYGFLFSIVILIPVVRGESRRSFKPNTFQGQAALTAQGIAVRHRRSASGREHGQAPGGEQSPAAPAVPPAVPPQCPRRAGVRGWGAACHGDALEPRPHPAAGAEGDAAGSACPARSPREGGDGLHREPGAGRGSSSSARPPPPPPPLFIYFIFVAAFIYLYSPE